MSGSWVRGPSDVFEVGYGGLQMSGRWGSGACGCLRGWLRGLADVLEVRCRGLPMSWV
ncbi:hypothetical protein DPMN_162111 [Dreissena polymorpha]|uniref:Uncharacterized protein n=1 Tax=Dreissena polymorpha TaxID=45954 RepID=A0A9D4IT91_DREPO|nr:hypothetical protein DPMN_162111 [Dreissena polymorpha]